MKNIPSDLVERFGVSNNSAVLSSNLREIISLTSTAVKVSTTFADFERLGHGDIRCVRFNTEEKLVSHYVTDYEMDTRGGR